MQKRILWGAAALVLLLVFAGCSQPTDFTNWGGSSGNPGSLKADVTYDGLVLLTWTPANDAKGYEVYRYDTVDKTPPKFLAEITQRGTTYYRDFVGEQNQLVDGRNYEYTVVAVNNAYGSSALPVKNGSSKVSAKPKIPEKGSDLSANLDVTVSEDGDFVLVTVNNQPNLNYTVDYIYGDNQFVYESAKEDKGENGKATGEAGWIFEKTRYIRFLKVGGDSTVTVKYSFAGNQNGTNGSYYGGGVSETQTVSYSVGGGLADVANFTITRYPEYALLEWDYDAEATGYEVYKAQVSGEPEFGGLTGGKVITFISNWAPVTITTPQYNGTTVLARETLTSATGNYVYAIKATGEGGAASGFAFTYETKYLYTTPQITAQPRGDDASHIQITWNNSEEGAVYKLERVTIEEVSPGAGITINSFVVTGEWENVPIETEDYVLDFGVVVDDSPTIGESYLYRLTATRYGITADPTFDIVAIDLFTQGTNFGLAISSDPAYNANKDFDDIFIEVTFGGDVNSPANRSRGLELFRRKVAGAGDATPWVRVDTISWSEGQSSYTYIGKVPDISWEYDYRIVVDRSAEKPNGVHNIHTDATITSVRGLGYGLTLSTFGSIIWKNSSTGDLGWDDQTSPGISGQTYPGLASGTVVIARGYTVSDVDDPTAYNNVGPNINGLTIKVRYLTTVVDPSFLDTEVTIVRVPGTAPTGSGPLTQHYYYSIQLPPVSTEANAPNVDFATGKTLKAIWYPWDDTIDPDTTTDLLTF